MCSLAGGTGLLPAVLGDASAREQIIGRKVFVHNKNGCPTLVPTYSFCSSEWVGMY